MDDIRKHILSQGILGNVGGINKSFSGDIEKGARGAITKRRTYNVGEISPVTGLQKQSDGSWKPPKKSGKKKTEKKEEISETSKKISEAASQMEFTGIDLEKFDQLYEESSSAEEYANKLIKYFEDEDMYSDEYEYQLSEFADKVFDEQKEEEPAYWDQYKDEGAKSFDRKYAAMAYAQDLMNEYESDFSRGDSSAIRSEIDTYVKENGSINAGVVDAMVMQVSAPSGSGSEFKKLTTSDESSIPEVGDTIRISEGSVRGFEVSEDADISSGDDYLSGRRKSMTGEFEVINNTYNPDVEDGVMLVKDSEGNHYAMEEFDLYHPSVGAEVSKKSGSGSSSMNISDKVERAFNKLNFMNSDDMGAYKGIAANSKSADDLAQKLIAYHDLMGEATDNTEFRSLVSAFSNMIHKN